MSDIHKKLDELILMISEQAPREIETLKKYNDHFLSERYIEFIFEPYRFGDEIDNNVNEMIKYLARHLKHQLDGLWSFDSIYQIMVCGGFLYDAKTSEKKKLTPLGEAFLRKFDNQDI